MASISSHQKNRYVLFTLLSICVVAVFCYLTENHAYFNSGTRVVMNVYEFYTGLVFALLLGFIYLLGARHYFKIKTNWFLLIVCSLFFLGGTIALFYYQNRNGDPMTTETLIRDISITLIEAFGVYLTMAVMPKVLRGTTTMQMFFVLWVSLCIAMTIWSYYKEGALYQKIWDDGALINASSAPKSWTTHRNIYAVMMLFGVFGEAFLNEKHPHWWRWVIILYLGVNICLTISKTTIIVGIFFVVSYYLYRFFATFKHHKIRNIIILVCVIAFFATGVTLGNLHIIAKYMPKIDSIIASIMEYVKNSSDASLTARLKIWTKINEAIKTDPIYLTFGFGEGNVQTVVDSVIGTLRTPMDSSFVITLAKFGYFGIVLFAILLLYLFINIIKSCRYRNHAWALYFLMLISYLAISVMETHNLLGYDSNSVLVYLIFVLPVLNESFYFKAIALNGNKPIYPVEKQRIETKNVYSYDVLRKEYVLWAPLFVLVIGFFAGSRGIYNMLGYSSIPALTSYGLCYLLLPLFAAASFNIKKMQLHGRPILTLATILYFISVFVVPYFGDLFVYCSMSLGLLILLVVALQRRIGPSRIIFESLWKPVSVMVFSLACLLLVYYFVKPYTAQLLFNMLAWQLIVYFFVFILLPKNPQKNWYLIAKWDNFETFFGHLALKIQTTDNKALRKTYGD